MEPECGFVVGQCLLMCPKEEMELRIREKIIHKLELPPNSSLQFDRSRMVKSYSRSAAGKALNSPKNLRPAHILLKTVNYLIDDIVTREDVPWIVIFEFVMDRFDSVRQELIIQNIVGESYINIMKPIVQFHAYAGYRLCENKKFESYINNRHLLEALKCLLNMYNYIEKEGTSVMDSFIESRVYFEAMYILHNLGEPEATIRCLEVATTYRDLLLRKTLDMSLNYLKHDYIKILRTILTLPELLAAVAVQHLPVLRKNLLEIMTVAFSSNILSFPLEDLRKLLLYDRSEDLVSDCKYYGLRLTDDGIRFLKGTFDTSRRILPPTRIQNIDEKLKNSHISDLIFCY